MPVAWDEFAPEVDWKEFQEEPTVPAETPKTAKEIPEWMKGGGTRPFYTVGGGFGVVPIPTQREIRESPDIEKMAETSVMELPLPLSATVPITWPGFGPEKVIPGNIQIPGAPGAVNTALKALWPMTIPASAVAKAGVGLASAMTTPKGLVELGALFTPAAPVVAGKWIYDMIQGAGSAAGDLSEKIERLIKNPGSFTSKDLQDTADDAVNLVATLYGAKKLGAHQVQKFNEWVDPKTHASKKLAEALESATFQPGEEVEPTPKTAGALRIPPPRETSTAFLETAEDRLRKRVQPVFETAVPIPPPAQPRAPADLQADFFGPRGALRQAQQREARELQAALQANQILPAASAEAAKETSTEKGAPSASSIEEAAAVHGDLRPQPEQGPGQVPAPQGGAGVQPQAQEGVSGAPGGQERVLLRGTWLKNQIATREEAEKAAADYPGAQVLPDRNFPGKWEIFLPDKPSPLDAPPAARLTPDEQAQVDRHIAGAAQLGRPVIELKGPDGKMYRFTYDGTQEWFAGKHAGQKVSAFTALEPLPGLKTPILGGIHSPALREAGFEIPEKLPQIVKPVATPEALDAEATAAYERRKAAAAAAAAAAKAEPPTAVSQPLSLDNATRQAKQTGGVVVPHPNHPRSFMVKPRDPGSLYTHEGLGMANAEKAAKLVGGEAVMLPGGGGKWGVEVGEASPLLKPEVRPAEPPPVPGTVGKQNVLPGWGSVKSKASADKMAKKVGGQVVRSAVQWGEGSRWAVVIPEKTEPPPPGAGAAPQQSAPPVAAPEGEPVAPVSAGAPPGISQPTTPVETAQGPVERAAAAGQTIVAGTGLEKAADEYLAKRSREGRASMDPGAIAAYLIKGVGLMERGVIKFADWAQRMVAAGAKFSHAELLDLYNEAKAAFERRAGSAAFKPARDLFEQQRATAAKPAQPATAPTTPPASAATSGTPTAQAGAAGQTFTTATPPPPGAVNVSQITVGGRTTYTYRMPGAAVPAAPGAGPAPPPGLGAAPLTPPGQPVLGGTPGARPPVIQRGINNLRRVVHFLNLKPIPLLEKFGVGDATYEFASARNSVPHSARDFLARIFPTQYKDPVAMAQTMDVINKDNILGGYDRAQADLADPTISSQEKTAIRARIRQMEAAHDLQAFDADVRAAMRDPTISGNIQRFGTEFNPVMDRQYNEMRDIAPDTAQETRGRHFGVRVNLLPQWKAGEMAKWADESQPQPETSVSNYLNPRMKGDPFARRAKLTDDYSDNAYLILVNSLATRTNEIAKLKWYKAMEGAGIAKIQNPGEPSPGEIGGQLAVRFPIEVNYTTRRGVVRSVKKDLWVREDIKSEVANVLDLGYRLPENPFFKALTTIQLFQFADATSHMKNIHTVVTSALGASKEWKDAVRKLPILGTVDTINRIGQVYAEILSDTPEIRREIAGMAKWGGIRPEYPLTGIQKITKMQKLIHKVDTASRIVMNRFHQNLVDMGRAVDTPAERRLYVQQIGEYNRKVMPVLMRIARDSSMSPFIVAGTTFNRFARRQLMGAYGFKATGTGEAVKARAMQIGGLVAAAALPAIVNMITTGQPGGRSGTPIGAIDTGTDNKQGDHRIIDVFHLLGFRRGLRGTGINAVVEGLRQGQSWNRIGGKAVDDIVSTAGHPWIGPGPGATVSTLSGKRFDLRGGASPYIGRNVGGGLRQKGEDLRVTLKNQNALLYGLAAPLLGEPEETWGESLGKGILSPFLRPIGWQTPARTDAVSQTHDLAVNWMEKSSDPYLQQKAKTMAGVERGQSPDPEYATLRHALRQGDMQKARKEYDRLLAIRSPDEDLYKRATVIAQAMRPFTVGRKVPGTDYRPEQPKPYTGKKDTEAAFLRSLTPEQRKMYDRAFQERMKTYRLFQQMFSVTKPSQ